MILIVTNMKDRRSWSISALEIQLSETFSLTPLVTSKVKKHYTVDFVRD